MPTPSGNLPTPDFTYDPATDLRAGRRPYRSDTYRLEAKPLGDKLLIHNYGHGGGGITMALGCALEVRDMVRDSGRAPAGTPVAVLGGGVMGLTVATLLKQMRLDVRMYAKSFTDTVSDIAGGQWAPSLMEYERTVQGKERFERILCRAFHGYKAMIDKGYGVSERPNYVNKKTDGFKKIPESLIKPVFVPSLPFEGHNGLSGWRYDTLLIEPPTFLGRLRRDLADQAVPRNQQTFSSPSQVSGLREAIVVNCTGLGSRRIWPDPKLTPKQGQLVFLKRQPGLQYLYSGMPQRGYIFPRDDFVVVGGTDDPIDNDDVDPTKCAAFIDAHKTAFAGRMTRLRAFMVPRYFVNK
jgi:D-amino-acid oxidase